MDCSTGVLHTQAVSTGAGPGLLKKLGRVLREKAAGDLERVFKGTSKTREKNTSPAVNGKVSMSTRAAIAGW